MDMTLRILRPGSDNQADSDRDPGSVGSFPVLAVLVLMGLLGILLYSFQSRNLGEFFSVISTGIMIAGASLLAGGLTGFLFGIPRTLQGAPAKPEGSQGEIEGEEVAYRANTNLEQISDWLTKILVGVGLTQIGAIPETLQKIAGYLAPGLGNFASSPMFAIAILIYFLICGFLLVYLWTRLYLAGAFRRADVEQKRLAKSAAILYRFEEQLDDSQKRQAREIRQFLEQPLGSWRDVGQARRQLADLAREYDRIRGTMGPGIERTSEMDQIVTRVRSLAESVDYRCEDIRRQFERGSAGARIVALGLLQGLNYPECLDLALEAIGRSRSAHEQYHALRAAESMLPFLTPEQMGKLTEVIEDQRSGGPEKYLIPQNVGRWNLSERILKLAKDGGK